MFYQYGKLMSLTFLEIKIFFPVYKNISAGLKGSHYKVQIKSNSKINENTYSKNKGRATLSPLI